MFEAVQDAHASPTDTTHANGHPTALTLSFWLSLPGCRVVAIPPRLGRGDRRFKSCHPDQLSQIAAVAQQVEQPPCKRQVAVITDEQSHDAVNSPKTPLAYMINVASAKNGVGYRNGWRHIDGFSEGVLRYIHAMEAMD